MSRVLVDVPSTAKRGETIQIRAMAAHVMETGFRRTQFGEAIPRNIITDFACTYDGEEVFRARLHPAISANPVFTFTTVATNSGTLEFRWRGDNGFTAHATARITVT